MRELNRCRCLTGSKENPGFSTVGKGGHVSFGTGKICISMDKNYFSLLSVIYNLQRCNIAAIES